jgi:serpin B
VEASAEPFATTAGALARSLERAGPSTLRIANQLFGEKTATFRRPFLDAMKAASGAEPEMLDFVQGFEAARLHINGWAEDRTGNHVRDLLPPGALSRDTRLVLASAVYFAGDWRSAFPKTATRNERFFASKIKKVEVPTMHLKASLEYAVLAGVRAVELPYAGSDVSMLVVVPDDIDGLAALEASLDAKGLDALVAGMRLGKVSLSLPSFTIAPTDSLPLDAHLRAMGMVDVFDRRRADLRPMVDVPAAGLVVDHVLHKSLLRVDEQGTEAAAATVMPSKTLGVPVIVPVIVDRPFLFFLRARASGLVIFMGRVTDPSGGAARMLDFEPSELASAASSRSVADEEPRVPIITGTEAVVTSAPADSELVVAKNKWRFRGCYSKALQTNPDAGGVVEVSAELDGTGTTKSASATGGTPASLATCIAKAFHSMHFAGEGTVKVRVTLTARKP